MKLSLNATTIVGAIFAAVCFSVAITGFISLDDVGDPTQLADAKGFIFFWAFLGALGVLVGALSQWLARTGKQDQDTA